MNRDELNPAAIMAEHPQRACFHPDGWYCGKCHVVAPCLPYRLAAALADAERRGAEKALREAASPEVSEWARKRTEDELIEMRDHGMFMIRANGLVVSGADGTPSHIIRLGFEMAWSSALQARADQIAQVQS